MHRYVIARGLIRIYSRTVCVLLRRSNLMGALLISWTTVLHYCRVQFPSWMVFANHWLLHWSQTSIIFGKDFLTEQKLGNLNNLPITHWVKCQQNMWRHFLLIIAAKKCQGFFRHSRGRDYDSPRLSSRLRKKEGEIASDDDDDAWVVAHGAEWGSRRSPSY